ncbi:sensor histidine kinase [Spirosoma endophyticum]|uniref:histidine kinase n=1 Tax=Spirosoma endophyticum TaxID=662367 RepID=A0A1I2AGG7_9BACT|nr:ATP-binding protein [Spirosoma endophyticum]SFE41930.1 PAS domain-containing protein [Spirosoma endophyticum]
MLSDQPTDVLVKQLLEALSDAAVWVRALRDETNQIIDFEITYVNQQAQHNVEENNQLKAGLRVLTDSLNDPGLNKKNFQQLCQVMETNQAHEFEYVSSNYEASCHIRLAKLADGILSIARTIPTLKDSDDQSTTELRTVIDSAQVAIFLIHPVRNAVGKIVDFRFRMANQMIASYVGQEPDALIGELISRWFPAYLTNGLFQRYVTIFDTGRTQHFNFHLHSDTIDSWVNITGVRLADDVLITFSDYTDFKKLQQRLEASASELQTVIDTSQTGIFLFSPVRNSAGNVVDFRFRVANQQLASYVGQKTDDVIGALGSTWFPDYRTNGLFDAYYRTYATGEPQRFDFHYDGGGINAWLDILSTKMGDEVLVTFSDYTPLKQLQQQLENSIIDLQRSNKNLEQFAYVASHDLQEPLRKIQAFGDIIQAQFSPILGEGGADMIGRMQSAAARMQLLIKDVLAYSRIANNRETVTSVDLNKIVDYVLSDIDTLISDKAAIVSVDLLPTVRGDAAQLRQLFQNLISNALKFTKVSKTDDPPTIAITTRRVKGNELATLMGSSIDPYRKFHLIEVADNGIGFDPHQAERIFEVFQRLHTRSEYKGTGIGLAIVQKVVDNHQGYIWAEGRPGEGATFYIALPVS